MNSSSCAQSEASYQETEARMLKEWDGARAEQDQTRDWKIPGWLNAPDWANWLQFCSQRGWMFVEDQPHVYGDGIMSAHGQDKDCLRSVRACEVPGVLFFSNRNSLSGGAAPFWVCDRRAGQALGATSTPTTQTSPPSASKVRKGPGGRS